VLVLVLVLERHSSSTSMNRDHAMQTDHPPPPPAPAPSPLHAEIVETLKTVYDPEIPVNIYDMGMIYAIEVNEEKFAHVTMTLTSPACPVAGTLPGEVEQKVKNVPGVSDGKVELVWDPPWTPEMMSEAARLELGM
jgi:FeS assembly SUF system protein